MQKQKIHINEKFSFFKNYLLHVNDFNEDKIREIKNKFTEIHGICRENIRALCSIVSLASYTTKNAHNINAWVPLY